MNAHGTSAVAGTLVVP